MSLKKNKIILGTVQFGLEYGINNKTGQPKAEKVFEILDYAFVSGINLLDTADAYGNAVELIGMYHQNRSNRFNVITKFKAADHFSVDEWTNTQLRRLKVEQLYGCMFHDFDNYKNNQHLVTALQKQQKKGYISKIGVSVYTNAQFEEVINDSFISLIQLPYNLLDNNLQRGDLLEKSQKYKKEIHTRSVFLQGLFFKNPDEFPKKLTPLKDEIRHLIGLSKTFKIDLGSIALNYALHHKSINHVLIGVDTMAQLETNLQLLNQEIPQELISIIDKINVKNIELLNPSNWK